MPSHRSKHQCSLAVYRPCIHRRLMSEQGVDDFPMTLERSNHKRGHTELIPFTRFPYGGQGAKSTIIEETVVGRASRSELFSNHASNLPSSSQVHAGAVAQQ